VKAESKSYGFPFRRFQLLDGVRKICDRWETLLRADDPRRWRIGELRRHVEGLILEADASPNALVTAHRLLCERCGSVHPGLASLCAGRSVKLLHECWLLKGYSCKVLPSSFRRSLG
jgi:hypothetical protein